MDGKHFQPGQGRWVIHNRSLRYEMGGEGVLVAGTCKGRVRASGGASKGKVAPVTVDICNIHTCL